MRNKKWVQLLAYVRGSVNQELLPQNEYLTAENRIVRAKLPSRLRLSDPERATRRDRETPGTKSTQSGRLCRQTRHHLGLVSKARRQEVRWLQTSAVSGPACGCSGSRSLVVRMARENNGWAYDRIVGALTNGHRLSDQTVGNILRRHGIAAPKRSQTTS